MSSIDQSLRLRAVELMQARPGEVAAADAFKQVLLERYEGNADAIAEVAGLFMAKTVKSMAVKTYELSEDQGILFDVSLIFVETERGTLFVRGQDATLDQVREWAHAGKQYHATQNLRFERFVAALEHVKDEPGDITWLTARTMIPAAAPEAVSDGK